MCCVVSVTLSCAATTRQPAQRIVAAATVSHDATKQGGRSRKMLDVVVFSLRFKPRGKEAVLLPTVRMISEILCVNGSLST